MHYALLTSVLEQIWVSHKTVKIAKHLRNLWANWGARAVTGHHRQITQCTWLLGKFFDETLDSLSRTDD